MARPAARLQLLLPLVAVLSVSLLLHCVHCQQKQHQYFVSRPQANVEVIQGTTIVLNCAVGGQTGAAQWSKNGFLLGLSFCA